MVRRSTAPAAIITMLLGSVFLSAQTNREIRPVTDAMLQNPEQGEWLNWRGAQDRPRKDVVVNSITIERVA